MYDGSNSNIVLVLAILSKRVSALLLSRFAIASIRSKVLAQPSLPIAASISSVVMV